VEHGYCDDRAGPGRSGRIDVRADRKGAGLQVEVVDDGVGLPTGFDLDRCAQLGLQIVRTLVTEELRGTLTLTSRALAPGDGGTGTRSVLQVPLAASPPVS
jgi:two-component sensor histidine kinase